MLGPERGLGTAGGMGAVAYASRRLSAGWVGTRPRARGGGKPTSPSTPRANEGHPNGTLGSPDLSMGPNLDSSQKKRTGKTMRTINNTDCPLAPIQPERVGIREAIMKQQRSKFEEPIKCVRSSGRPKSRSVGWDGRGRPGNIEHRPLDNGGHLATLDPLGGHLAGALLIRGEGQGTLRGVAVVRRPRRSQWMGRTGEEDGRRPLWISECLLGRRVSRCPGGVQPQKSTIPSSIR